MVFWFRDILQEESDTLQLMGTTITALDSSYNRLQYLPVYGDHNVSSHILSLTALSLILREIRGHP